MAVSKTARVTRIAHIGPDALVVDLCPAEPLTFVGGQYVIVNTQLLSPTGKGVKRAYSILSQDSEQRHCRLAVKPIPDGPGSGYMFRLQPGAEVLFSGPWGKCVPREGGDRRTLILATDTGITAAIGLVQSTRFRSSLPITTLIWLRESPEYFLPDLYVRAWIPSRCSAVHIARFPPIGHPDRLAHVRTLLQAWRVASEFGQVFLSGDGAVNEVVSDDLAAAGWSGDQLPIVESFFNMPKKSQ